MESSLEAGVVTALGADWPPEQLVEQVRHIAQEHELPEEHALRALPDILIRIVFAVDPAPAQAMHYLSALCIAPLPSENAQHAFIGAALVSLLKHADHDANKADQVCALFFHGSDDALPITAAELAKNLPDSQLWPTAFALVRLSLQLHAPRSASASLFMRLATQTHNEPLPDSFAALLHDVESACTQNAAWSPIAQTLANFEKHPEDAETRMSPSALPDLWSGRQTLAYALGLAGAAHQLQNNGGRTPALPQAPHPEPDTVLFVYHLSSDAYDWSQKCAMAQGLLAVRLAYTEIEPKKARLAFYVELLIATSHAALTCISTHQDRAPYWRGFVGGILPPLLRYLDSESSAEAQRMLSATLAAFVELHAPLSQWAAAEPAMEPALPEHILRCMASWGLVETHASEPVQPDELVRVASPDLQQYAANVQAQIQVQGGLAALAMQAASDPARQLCFAHVVARFATSWYQGLPNNEHVAEVCGALGVPGACNALFLFYSRPSFLRALLAAVQQLTPRQWQDADELASISTALLFLQRFPSKGMDACGPASVFLAFAQIPTLPREAWSQGRAELLDRWMAALVGPEGLPDVLLRYVSQLTQRLAPVDRLSTGTHHDPTAHGFIHRPTS